MTKREWNEVHETGVPMVDGQHRRMYALYNRLYDATLQGAPEPQLTALLAEFLDQTELHFTTEERFMERMGYAYLEQHRVSHSRLMAYGRHLQGKLASGQERFSRAILVYLGNWMERHLETEDADYAEHARRHGSPECVQIASMSRV